MTSFRHSAEGRTRTAARCAALRMAFGVSLFAATGAGAGAAGTAHAATHASAAQGAAVVHVGSADR